MDFKQSPCPTDRKNIQKISLKEQFNVRQVEKLPADFSQNERRRSARLGRNEKCCFGLLI
ncbi:hypothetical protein LEP1GSC185_1594 [Leptospira licerasiae serovar Varillal str. VAR 010]|nr:hypothetical protein LEP1GSC185_1594 [Leptospira licerasiae serovar Varillal str. VAR 010]